jgi:hypothetical protein
MCLGASNGYSLRLFFALAFSLSDDLVNLVRAIIFRLSMFGRKNMDLNLTALPNSAV